MELFQVARKKTMTERTCRGAIRKAGIYPFDPKAVLNDSLKGIEKGRLTEPSDGDSASSLQLRRLIPLLHQNKQKAPAPIDTPHNTGYNCSTKPCSRCR